MQRRIWFFYQEPADFGSVILKAGGFLQSAAGRRTDRAEDRGSGSPYELHDFFLYYFLRFGYEPDKIYRIARLAFEGEYEKETIYKWLETFCRRFFTQQFKRSCLPDGPKVGTVALSPRGDWRMPSDACASVWLKNLEQWWKETRNMTAEEIENVDHQEIDRRVRNYWLQKGLGITGVVLVILHGLFALCRSGPDYVDRGIY